MSSKLEELKKQFDTYDLDGNGKITYKELVQVFKKLGTPMESEDIKELLKEADIDGDKKLSWEEFRKHSGY